MYKIACLLCVIFVCACTPPAEEHTINVTSRNVVSNGVEELLSSDDPDNNKSSATYRGRVACNSCDTGIMTLEIFFHNNTYQLLNKKNAVTKGNFNTERGYDKDDDATVYVLNDDQPEDQQIYFVRETGEDSVLVQLDKKRQRLAKTYKLKMAFAKQ